MIHPLVIDLRDSAGFFSMQRGIQTKNKVKKECHEVYSLVTTQG